MWGCAWLCDSTRVPHTFLCLLCVGPTVSLGQLIPASGPEQRTAVGVLSDSGSKSQWDMETHGQGWEGSRCPSRVLVTTRDGWLVIPW